MTETLRLPENEAQAFIEAIEKREITLTATIPPDQVYAGNCWYKASNGWELIVFNDCGQFDYIDSITTNDGRVIQSFCEHGVLPQCEASDEGFVRNYTGPVDARECYRLYGIPPYVAHPVEHVWTSTMPAGSPVEFFRSPDTQKALEEDNEAEQFGW